MGTCRAGLWWEGEVVSIRWTISQSSVVVRALASIPACHWAVQGSQVTRAALQYSVFSDP